MIVSFKLVFRGIVMEVDNNLKRSNSHIGGKIAPKMSIFDNDNIISKYVGHQMTDIC